MKKIIYRTLALITCLNMSPVLAIAPQELGDTYAALRDDEKAYLDQLNAKKNKDSTAKDAYDSAEHDISKIEICQAALKKIDKLSLEQAQLENCQTVKLDDELYTPRRGKERAAKAKALQSQIQRYKIQARDYCPEKYLRESQHM